MKFLRNKILDYNKRYMILLEILIAIAIVALCILPLIAPHIAILNAQKKFINTMKMDNFTHLLYVDVMVQLQKNTIAWPQIQNKASIPIDDAMWKRIGQDPAPKLKGSFRFEEFKHKENKATGWSGNLFKLIFSFNDLMSNSEGTQNKQHIYPYTVYILKKGPAEVPPPEPPKPPTNTPKKTGKPK